MYRAHRALKRDGGARRDAVGEVVTGQRAGGERREQPRQYL